MNPTSRSHLIGLITFFCAFILCVGLVALSSGSATPSASAALLAAQAGEEFPEPNPTAPPGCVLDWSIASSPSPGTAFNALYSISAVSANDIWAVGSYAQKAAPTVKLTLVEHWDGSEWSVVPSPNPGSQYNNLNGVDAISADNVWAAGWYGSNSTFFPLLLHWNGSDWNTVPGPASACQCYLFDVEAVSSNDVWAVGLNQDNGHPRPLIVHWDGSQSVIVPSPFDGIGGLRAIHAISGSDIWAVGTSDTSSWTRLTLTMHWDGVAWTVVPSPNWENSVSGLHGVTGRYSTEVWAVGYRADTTARTTKGLILRWNGTQWAVAPSPDPVGMFEDYLMGVTTVSPDDIWAVGITDGPALADDRPLSMHWDGWSWTTVQVPPSPMSYSLLYGVAGVLNSNVWAVGYSGNWGVPPSQTLVERSLYTCSTPSPTASPTETSMPATSTYTPAPTFTVAPTNPPTSTPTLTSIPTHTPTHTSTALPTSTLTPLSTSTHTATPYSTATLTPTTLPTHTVTSTPTHTTAPTHTAIATSTLTPIPCSMQFVDVHPGDYFYEPVRYLYCEGFIAGYADNSFRPWNITTRAQLAKIVVSAKGWQLLNPQSATFTDVPANSTFYRFIETAAAHGIIAGYPCGNPEPCDAQNRPYFRPNAEVTRGQITRIIVAAQGWPLLDPQTPRFGDVAKGSTFYKYIETAVSHGIIAGYPCGNPEPCDTQNRPYFRPGNPAPRGQIARIVYNAVTTP